MSAPCTFDGSQFKTISLTFSVFPESLEYVITHVFLPFKVPDYPDYSVDNDFSLAHVVCAAAHAYSAYVDEASEAQWHRIKRMLDSLQMAFQSEHLNRALVISQLHGMQTGDILAFLIRSENFAIVLTKRESSTLFESFEVSPHEDELRMATGPLKRSYPEFAAEIPLEIFDDEDFRLQLADFLCRSDVAQLDRSSPARDHARYIAALFSGTLHSVDGAVDVPCIVKRVRDAFDTHWRRSSLWLLIRVVIQMSFDRCPLGRAVYKAFMLFFITAIPRSAELDACSTDLLCLIASKILCRLKKLGSSIPDVLSQLALKSYTDLQKIIDARWIKLSARPSHFRNPSQDELRRDTRLSLEHTHEYIRNALTNHGQQPNRRPFHPNHRRRGTIEDFLSSDESLFDEACGSLEAFGNFYMVSGSDSVVTLYDIEQSVEQNLDDWIAGVTNVEDACIRLGILMDRYMKSACYRTPEDISICLLTGLELFVALDKLITNEIPMFVDYSPEIPIPLLEKLLLRGTSLHRLSRVYQYLSTRHSRSQPGWSILSDVFAENSFPIRYYDQSPRLQQLKARIEMDAMAVCGGRQYLASKIPKSPLPALLLHAKVIVFELQCPACILVWRSAAARIFFYFRGLNYSGQLEKFRHGLGGDDIHKLPLALQRYHVDRVEPRLHIHICFDYCSLTYALRSRQGANHHLRMRELQEASSYFLDFSGVLWSGSLDTGSLGDMAKSTTHASNDVLAAQVHCPANLSLDEFISFGHLRSGGSLQWINILQALRSRAPSPHCPLFHFLLTVAVLQVGPLDPSTGAWIWHQELQETSFCNSLLDEVENLSIGVQAAPIDGVMMNNISLLLTRLLASAPSEDISERAIELLQSVRRKTLKWVRELSYNLAMAPTKKERGELLLDMATTCRSTFYVDSVTLPKLFLSAEDVDAALSYYDITPRIPSAMADYLELLLARDRRISLVLEAVLRDIALVDPSNYGVDLAVRRVFPSYKPSASRWGQLPHPNSRWLICQTKATAGQPSQAMHLNLLTSELRVDGQSSGGLPRTIRDNKEYQKIFMDQGFFVVPSNLPGTDFTTLCQMSKHKLHYSLQNDDPVIRVESDNSKDILQLVPWSRLKEDLPLALVDGHVHWLNLSTKIIEIRPLERPWEESADNWRIDCTSGRYHAYKGDKALVDIRSPTWAMLSRCFECLNPGYTVSCPFTHVNCCNDLLITTSPIDPLHPLPVLQLSTTISRYGLSFFVNKWGKLESYDFKDMVYSDDQCVGALYGLENLLVLQQHAHLPAELIPRCVLIPDGAFKWRGIHLRADYHCRHRNNTITGMRGVPLYHTYRVDTELCCLVGNGDIASTECLVILHSMTSWDRPDPLTGKTGAQAAYSISNYFKYSSFVHRIRWSTHMSSSNLWHASSQTSPEDYNHRDGTGCSTTPPLAELTLARLTNAVLCLDQTMYPIVLHQLLSARPAPLAELPPRSTLPRGNRRKTAPGNIPKLDRLFTCPALRVLPSSTFQQEYLAHLSASPQHTCVESGRGNILKGKGLISRLEEYYTRCRGNYLTATNILKERLAPGTDLDHSWLLTTADILLRSLASTSPISLPGQWKECLVSLALLLLDLQRARRLLRYALEGSEEEYLKELENEACDGWDPEKYPDWLLIQIEGNFLIRRNQAEIAMEMMSPEDRRNTVVQVNMGEGKSSVIIPIVAAALADGSQLVRVIVPKALIAQMFDLLVARLGGLVNRPIYHLPFSRSESLGRFDASGLHGYMSRCMAERGVLLMQPEHVASLKLMSIEKQIHASKPRTKLLVPKFRPALNARMIASLLKSSSERGIAFRWLSQLYNHSQKCDVSRDDTHDEHTGNVHGTFDSVTEWLSLQKWIHSYVRDILDESDEVLHPRFQLIYTVGLEQHLDGCPHRWTITQQVLHLIREHAPTLAQNLPDCIEYQPGPPGSFPYIRCIRDSPFDVGQHLILLIVKDVLTGRLQGLTFDGASTELRDAIRSFISDENVCQVPDTVERVEEYAKRSDGGYVWSVLLLLRGLLALKILPFGLSERRWRVDYGLLPQDSELQLRSTKLAVPYLGKDMPSPNTQFGHPDIAIILTCLSYYYSGLSEAQLRSSFEILLNQDDPYTEFAFWIKDYDHGSLPDSVQQLSEINLKSSEQWDKVIFPLFSKNQATIDFYLSRVVFPEGAKEFPWKLSASSWDLAEEKNRNTKGFSGTNDNRCLLPLSVVQRDLDSQRGTDARVLAYLLRPENDFYLAIHQNNKRETTHELLTVVARQTPEIRVLLDVGAQILDLSNIQVAEAWLGINRDATGAVYFNEQDKLMVVDRYGASVSMTSSPLSQQLGCCVVYLDHAHTRGTDIQLPIGSRAAVTLGPNVTKDRLTQGCMRMRKLGCGHSVMFFSPPEVDLSIRALAEKQNSEMKITTADVLCWAIHETWNEIQQRAPSWAQQGMDYKLRCDAWTRFCNGELTHEELMAVWLQPERKSLEDLYAPSQAKGASILSTLDPVIRQRCKDLGVLSLPITETEEEQEREVNREKEREREAELPPEAKPAKHALHQDVVNFVKTGVTLPLHSSSTFRPIFTTLNRSSAATHDADVWSPFILATVDFCNTIELESTEGSIDQYLRPVQWVLSSRRDPDEVLVLVSPFEVDRLMPEIRASEHILLHVYAPRRSQCMRPSDDLRLYTIPPLPPDWCPPWGLVDQLNVFAGQLYLRDYESYLRLCEFLGIPMKESSVGGAARRNLFNIPGMLEENEITFSDSPLSFVMALLAMRNRGRPFEHTHMGKILQGQRLTEEDFEKRRPVLPGHAHVGDQEIEGDSEIVLLSPVVCDPRDGTASSALSPFTK